MRMGELRNDANADIAHNPTTLKYYLKDKVEWLVQQWGTSGTTAISATQTSPDTKTTIHDMQGRQVTDIIQPGIYIIRNANKTRKVIVK